MEIKLNKYISQNTNISEDSRDLFKSFFDKKIYKKGEFLFEQGDICRHIYFIEKGLARTFYFSQNGKEITAMFFKEGNFLTALDSFYHYRSTKDNCQFLEESTVYSLHIEKMNELLVSQHDFAILCFNASYELNRIITEYNYALKFQSAKERYDLLLKEYPKIFQRVASTHIASFLGISAETLSRLKAK